MSEVSNVVPITGPSAVAVRIQETGVLLERATYVRPLHHDVVYALIGGRVGSAPLARYRLPKSLRGSTLVAPEYGDTDGLAMLPQLAVHADRIAPWLAVHIVPKLLTRRRDGDDFGRASGYFDVEGGRYSSAGGLACYDERLVLIASATPTKMSSILFHEIFHHCWHFHLSDAARYVLKAAVAQGADWPGDYYGSVAERTARLFESWAWARMEGMPNAAPVPMTVEGIFDLIWSGQLADDQIQHGLVDGHEALRIRRGLPALPPSKPEVVEPEPTSAQHARIDDVVCDWIWDGCAALVRLVGRGVRLAAA